MRKKHLQTAFQSRQHMLKKDFELYYYSDYDLSKVDMHSHDYYEFYLFLEGNVEMQIDHRTWQLTPGNIILIPPNVSHCLRTLDLNSTYRRFVFWISQDYYASLIQRSKDYGFIVRHVEENHVYVFPTDRITFNEIQYECLCLIEEINSGDFGHEAQMTLSADGLVLHLNRLVYAQLHPRSYYKERTLFQQMNQYIEEHLEENLSLETLSAAFYVSKFYISHMFKQNLGISVHQYITKKRLAKCRQAILGDMSITEAYQTFGFGDYSGFYRAFKKEYGISPKDFVNAHSSSSQT